VELGRGRAALEPPPLPVREVGELEGRLRQRRRPPRAARGMGAVERGELAEEYIEGPPVVDQVMLDVEQEVLARLEPEESPAREREKREVEGPRQLACDRALRRR